MPRRIRRRRVREEKRARMQAAQHRGRITVPPLTPRQREVERHARFMLTEFEWWGEGPPPWTA